MKAMEVIRAGSYDVRHGFYSSYTPEKEQLESEILLMVQKSQGQPPGMYIIIVHIIAIYLKNIWDVA